MPDKLKSKLKSAPDRPGCYLMRDGGGEIIYIGKAVSLRKRLQYYFRKATLKSAPPKLRGMVKSVSDIDYVIARNEAEAVITESSLIKEYKPRYNVSLRDDKRFLLLRADPAEEFPVFSLQRIRRDDGASYFGPYASALAARTALDFVEKRFGLRKCSPRVPDDKTYRHCINDIVRYCSAPCIGKIDRPGYMERFNAACEFLRGDRPGLLIELRTEMRRLADALEFEKAADLRDTALMLESAVKARARVVPTPGMKAAELERAMGELRDVLGLDRPPAVIEAYDISSISGTYAVGSLVLFSGGAPDRKRYRRFRIKSADRTDDPEMIGEVIRRRFERQLVSGGVLPDLVLVDGGVTQLKSACAQLRRLGLAGTAVAGLAKRLEELHVPGREQPVRMSRDSAALKLLQRVRDEAHRFAIAYHRRMRGARIRESVLDEAPGIGQKRKELILRHFGSVRRLAQASPEEIARIPGLGKETAASIAAAMRGYRASHGPARQREK